MKTTTYKPDYTLGYKKQFRHCQATETRRDCEDWQTIRVFYSYTCPKLVFMDHNWYKFTFENSRKAGCITGSQTTSKQCNNYLRDHSSNITDYHKLPKINLEEFENQYFDTRLETYY